MDNHCVLYCYELKKLSQKKILWISLGICLLAIAFSLLFPLVGNYYVDGTIIDSNYNFYLTDQAYRKDLSGRAIDQALLEETIDAYSHVPLDVTPYSLTEEYQTYARPYSEIFNLIRTWTGKDASSAVQWEPDEANFYSAMQTKMETVWNSNYLTDSELAYWQNRAGSLQTPFVYQYHDGYMYILEVFLTVGVMMMLFIAIALANVFPDEHTQRTDQLLLCTIGGRKYIYWIKTLSGITVGCAGALLMTIFTWTMSLIVYGTDGFDMAIQLFCTTYAGHITIGQACLIAYGCLLITALLISIMVMFLSEWLHSGIAALSVTTAMILASCLFQVPAEYRLLGQLWDYLPTSFLTMWNTFDCRLIPVFGRLFTSYQIIPLVYIGIAFLLAVLGQQKYARYQISGR